MSRNLTNGLARVPAPAVFVVGGVSMYAGAAVAVDLFATLRPSGVAWLRLVGAAAMLLAWRRPPSEAWRGRRVLVAAMLGIITGVMNAAFYEAIARLPLGTTVALEFCGPIVVAALASRAFRDWAALVLAGVGVALIADVRWEGSPFGVLFALAAAAAWAGYIVAAKRVAQTADGVTGLAVGFGVAAVVLVPLAAGTGPAWTSPRLLVLGVGVGVLSSVVPYVLDQIVLRRVGRARFAVLLALLPLTATVMGVVTLRQVPAGAECVGIVAVVLAVLLRSKDGDEPSLEQNRSASGPRTDQTD
jgi:inner membrane transporter RhtA